MAQLELVIKKKKYFITLKKGIYKCLMQLYFCLEKVTGLTHYTFFYLRKNFLRCLKWKKNRHWSVPLTCSAINRLVLSTEGQTVWYSFSISKHCCMQMFMKVQTPTITALFFNCSNGKHDTWVQVASCTCDHSVTAASSQTCFLLLWHASCITIKTNRYCRNCSRSYIEWRGKD